jgi:phosphoribosylanthranilate isomerase
MKTRVKICGVRRMEDAMLAAELGAAAIGFIFWPESRRFIDPYRARTIAAALPPWLAPIGVFVDQPPEYVSGVAALLNLSAVQLHGQERVRDYAQGSRRLIKSVPVSSSFDRRALDALPPDVTVLLDAHDPVRRGGTGRAIDWDVAADVARSRRTILSGGLTADNVKRAVNQVRPYGVDVSSGVETSPGVKDAAKLRDFFAAIND